MLFWKQLKKCWRDWAPFSIRKANLLNKLSYIWIFHSLFHIDIMKLLLQTVTNSVVPIRCNFNLLTYRCMVLKVYAYLFSNIYAIPFLMAAMATTKRHINMFYSSLMRTSAQFHRVKSIYIRFDVMGREKWNKRKHTHIQIMCQIEYRIWISIHHLAL